MHDKKMMFGVLALVGFFLPFQAIAADGPKVYGAMKLSVNSVDDGLV